MRFTRHLLGFLILFVAIVGFGLTDSAKANDDISFEKQFEKQSADVGQTADANNTSDIVKSCEITEVFTLGATMPTAERFDFQKNEKTKSYDFLYLSKINHIPIT